MNSEVSQHQWTAEMDGGQNGRMAPEGHLSAAGVTRITANGLSQHHSVCSSESLSEDEPTANQRGSTNLMSPSQSTSGVGEVEVES